MQQPPPHMIMMMKISRQEMLGHLQREFFFLPTNPFFHNRNFLVNSYPQQCSALRKNGFVMLKNRPCKIMEMSTSKTGKHGHAKVLIHLALFRIGKTCLLLNRFIWLVLTYLQEKNTKIFVHQHII